MDAYLVRLRETEEKAREIVGFFVAATLDMLAHYVDECADVDRCEYALLPGGGLYWPAFTDFAVPFPDEENPPALPGEGQLTDAWSDYVYGDEEDLVWFPLEWPYPEEELADVDSTPSRFRPWRRVLRRRRCSP